MGGQYWQSYELYGAAGGRDSDITSEVIDTRLAFDITVSWHTSTSDVTSIHTYQFSNSLANQHQAIAEDTWVSWQTFGDTSPGASATTNFDPPLGYRWARIIREVTTSGMSALMHVQYRA